MDEAAWERFLRRWSEEILSSPDAEGLPRQAVASRWLGQPGATEEDIQEAERRLETKLPPSYRRFLTVSNGWGRTTPFIDRLWSTREIAWLRERRADLIAAWRSGDTAPAVSDADYFVYGPEQYEYNMRSEYLETALEISDEGDAAFYLLNPQVVTPSGEWEAWFFASWLPGARRYRSFQDLMLDEYESFKKLRGR